jgi:serine/threonine protein kinase
LIGKTISHYQIIEKLGVGGMGVVYKAQDLNLDRFVALKFLPPHLTTIGEEKQRFIHEAKAASALQHNNICAIHEIDETEDDQIFICMDYYQGETLNKKIKEKPLPIEEAVDVISQIAEGLLDAHEKGLVHRDIKPANIFITKDDIVKILDFGLAKSAKFTQLTKNGSTIGTVAYMSPEQTRGAQVDQRTDIWSLGVVMYEIITGELPFKGDYEQAIIYSILHEDPEPISTENSDIPPEVIHVITKALTKDPDNRYQTIGEFLSDLKNFASPEYESLSFGSSKISKKHYPRWLFFVSGAFIILLASILYFINPFGSDSRRLESIVVLPFENYTGNDELEYFVAGMHSSLIGDIGKISALRVISKTTSNAYKNVEKSIPEIASELGVDAVIEAFVLSLGDSVRLQVKLVDVFPEEQQLWVQDYYEEKSQILTLYNKVTKEISEEINIVLTPQEQNLLTEDKIVKKEEYDGYLKGNIYWE